MSYTEEFEIVPSPPPSGLIGFLYVYIKSIIDWILTFFYPNTISYFVGLTGKARIFELEEALLWRPNPIDFETNSLKEILQSLRPECSNCDEPRLLEMISNIKKYFDLRTQIETIRTTKVDRKNHRKILQIIYEQILDTKIIVGLTKEEDRIFNPQTTAANLYSLPKSETSPDWTLIGFQGTDPLSDFRGGGLLSLQQLAYFAENYKNEVKSINSRANHPTKGYGWAITGINITVLLIKAVKSGLMKKYFYNREVTVTQFHISFCESFRYFDAMWTFEDPADIMQFSIIFAKFREDFVTFMKNGQEMQFAKK